MTQPTVRRSAAWLAGAGDILKGQIARLQSLNQLLYQSFEGNFRLMIFYNLVHV